MKLFVGVAPFEGRLHAPTVTSLLGEQISALLAGVELSIQILQGAHYVAESYNILLARFLRSGCDKLAFVEWDVSWAPGKLCKLAKIPHDYVGASTRHKKADEDYMIGWLDGELWADEYGCLEVAWIPQGFSVMTRAMAKSLWDAAEGREYENHGETLREVFRDGFHDGRQFGQDTRLCHDWRKMGGKVFVHPEIELTHTACVGHAYTGRLGDWLRGRINGDGGEDRNAGAAVDPCA